MGAPPQHRYSSFPRTAVEDTGWWRCHVESSLVFGHGGFGTCATLMM